MSKRGGGRRFPRLGSGTGDETRERLHAHEPKDIEGEWDTLVLAGSLRSANWDGGGDLAAGRDTVATAGFLVDAVSGRAQFVTIYADGGELRTLSVTGTLTLSGSGKVVTAASGQRVEITAAGNDRVTFYSGHASEAAAAYIYSITSDPNDSLPLLTVRGPKYGTADTALMLHSDRIDVEGDLLPDANNTYDLGSSVRSWAQVYAFGIYDEAGTTRWDLSGPITAADGSGAAPAFSFSADPNTGMYRSGADSLGFAAGGSQVAEITAGGIYAGTPATGLPIMRPNSDDLDYCSFSFGNDADTGMNRTAANALVLVAGAVERLKVDDDGSGNCVLVYVSGALHRVSEGAADSGGAGYKVLRVPN